MILRLRSRDGLERVEVPNASTLGDLKLAIVDKLHIPVEDIKLSKDSTLLVSKTPDLYATLGEDSATLSLAGLGNGDMIFLWYPGERDVEPAYKRRALETRGFGQKMTVEEMVARQVRIERQEHPKVASVSFDRHAADVFQAYVRTALAFSIKRGGILYGVVDDADNVKVEFIYEPPQEGSADQLVLERCTEEEQKVDFVAELLGYKKLGWIISQSTKERGFILSTGEVRQMAAMQDELGEKCVTAVVSFDSSQEGGHVHFEAYQCSQQCVKLWKEGWFEPDQEEHSGVMKIRNPKDPKDKNPVIIAGKDVDEVDNDFFLCPVKILDHTGSLSCTFPVENRLIPQGKTELKKHLQEQPSRAYVQRLSDFHVLLYLAKQCQLDDSDVALLCKAVRYQEPVLEGYRVIIDSIAGIG